MNATLINNKNTMLLLHQQEVVKEGKYQLTGDSRSNQLYC